MSRVQTSRKRNNKRGEVNAKTTKKMENTIMVQDGFRDVRNDLHTYSHSRLSSSLEATTTFFNKLFQFGDYTTSVLFSIFPKFYLASPVRRRSRHFQAQIASQQNRQRQ
jgi:hypothetical protein